MTAPRVDDVPGVVVLVSGSGTLLQALIDAAADEAYGVRIAAVGADRDAIEALARAERAGIPTFVCRVADFATREDWDTALTDRVAEHAPDLVVSAGFLKLVGAGFLARFDTLTQMSSLTKEGSLFADLGRHEIFIPTRDHGSLSIADIARGESVE